jgi:hypothetical protein
VTSDLVFTGNRGSASVALGDITATFDISQTNLMAVSGMGTLNVSGVVASGLVDLSRVGASIDVTFNDYDAQNDELGDDNTIDVAAGGTLRLTAAAASGASITGEGVVEVVDAARGSGYDFSTLADGLTVSVQYADVGTIDLSTDFSGVDTVKLAAGVTTMTAAQADDLAFTGSAEGASVNITGSAGVQNLQGTAGNDTIATGTDADTVDLSQGGSDRVIFNGNPSDVAVTSFTAAATADGGDIMDFSLISGLDVGGYTAFDMVDGGESLTTGVVGILGAFADTAANVQSLFTQAQGFLNGKVDANSPSDIVFLISNPADEAVRAWYWNDGAGAAADKNVQAAELTMLGTFTGMANSDLLNLTSQNLAV